MKRRILVLNAGSSSLKYALYDAVGRKIQRVKARGVVECIGQPVNATIKHSIVDEDTGVTKTHKTIVKEMEDRKEAITGTKGVRNESGGYAVAFNTCLRLLKDTVPRDGKELTIHGVGHRVVHGGESMSSSRLIDDVVLTAIKRASPLAPLHNPANLLGIETAMSSLPAPNTAHCAVFDTAFHATIPPHAFMYALPIELYKEHGIRKYGFHGTSHQYILEESARFLNKRVDTMNMIVCHLGAGSSVCCIKNGQSIDTSMGLTPLEGLVMSTRSGDIDPSVVFYLMDELGLSKSEVHDLLNKKSGWFGLCGHTDAREIEQRAERGEELSQLARQVMVHRIRKYLGAYLLNLGGKLDAVVFTAGLGENWASLRELCMRDLEGFGIEVDRAKNASVEKTGIEGCNDVSTFVSQVRIFVIPTDEEKHIAKQVLQLINYEGDGGD